MSSYRTDLDGLRGVAIIAVMANHIDHTYLPNGHLGVDIFFVISGYVITQALLARHTDTLGQFLRNFYERRIRRLFPALFACVLITSICVLLVTPSGPNATTYTRTGLTALVGLSNLYLLRQATDYFSYAATLNPFTHTWSLGVEEQFYIFFPFLMWAAGLPRATRGATTRFALTLTILATISLFAYLVLSRENPSYTFYLMPLRFWEIAAGALAYLIVSKKAAATDLRLSTSNIFSLLAAFLLGWVLWNPLQLSSSVVSRHRNDSHPVICHCRLPQP